MNVDMIGQPPPLVKWKAAVLFSQKVLRYAVSRPATPQCLSLIHISKTLMLPDRLSPAQIDWNTVPALLAPAFSIAVLNMLESLLLSLIHISGAVRPE